MTRTFALVIGLLFLVMGILGFVPWMTTEGGEYLFGIFRRRGTQPGLHAYGSTRCRRL